MDEQEIIDWSYFYLLPMISFIGFVLEIISTLTFIKIVKNNHTDIYKYLLAYSVSDAMALFIHCFIGVFKCGVHCNIEHSLAAKIYEFYIYLFIGNIFNTLSVFIDLKISLDRYLLISQKSNARLNKPSRPKLTITIFSALSILLNIPYLFIYEIDKTETAAIVANNSTKTLYEFRVELSDRFKTNAKVNLMAIVGISKDFVLLFLVFTINIMMTIAFRQRLRKKQYFTNCETLSNTPNLKADEKQTINDENVNLNQILENHETTNAQVTVNKFVKSSKNTKLMNNYNTERRVTLMILFLCLIFLLGHIPEMLYKLKSSLHNNYKLINFNYLPFFLIFANFMSFSTRGLNFFVYFLYNLVFRNALKDVFSKN